MLLLLLVIASGKPVFANQNKQWHKVLAPPGLFTESQEVIRWHDYDSFVLYRVSPDAWRRLPESIRQQTQRLSDNEGIKFAGKVVSSDKATLQKGIENPSDQFLHLIQFVGPLKDDWLTAVSATGSEPIHYVNPNAYLIWTDERGKKKLDQLAAENDFIQASIPFTSSYKLDNSLALNSPAGENEVILVTIQMLDHENKGASENFLENLLINKQSSWEKVLHYQNITGTVYQKDLETIITRPDVVWVGKYHPPELNDEVQGQILARNLLPNEKQPREPGYLDWLMAKGFSQNPEVYPVVDITDDGIGNGLAEESAGDSTLRILGDGDQASRLVYIANCTAALDGGSPHGHGHINISIAGGYDNRPGYPYQDLLGYQRGLGINPFGRFAGTRIFDEDFDLRGCGNSYQSLLRNTYNRGARIVSNSWGCASCAALYDAAAQTYDAGVRDADPEAAGNQELTILFSAGNNGPDSQTIGSPGNAKNVITVGASEGTRSDWIDGCRIEGENSDNAQDIAFFSSRGPAPGARVKPDILAPGTHIQGTASTNSNFSGKSICDPYFPLDQKMFSASSGTSHSTPAIAGFASLASYWLSDRFGVTEPSPALIKAFLLANTSYLTDSGAADSLPSFNQGFGLADMSQAFDSIPTVIVDQSKEEVFDQSGEEWSLTVSPGDYSKPVKIVMAYTDYPGAIGTDPQVNDLDLSIQMGGKTYFGNQMVGPWSVPGGYADKANNVEAVFLPEADKQSIRIVITAANIAGDGVPQWGDDTDQDFVLICSNCQFKKDFLLTAEPKTNSLCSPGSVDYTIKLEPVMSFADPVSLQVNNLPVGVSVKLSQNEIIPPGESQLTLEASEVTTAGISQINITGISQSVEHFIDLELNLQNSLPTSPTPQFPANGATDLPVMTTLSWSPVSQEATYSVQVAMDPAFTRIIEKSEHIIGTSFAPSNLLPGQIYYWRVRAENICGQSPNSSRSVFSTEPGPDACPVGIEPEIIYHTDFETAEEEWLHGGSHDTWQQMNTRAHSGTMAFRAQAVNLSSDQFLISPLITLPQSVDSLTLQYWNYQDIEKDEDENDICFDGGLLEISTNNGQTWQPFGEGTFGTELLMTDPYDGFISNEFGNPLAGRYGWCGQSQDWTNSIINLNGLAGQEVRFRFRLGTDASVGGEGWFIDDIRVQSCTYPRQEIFLPLTINRHN